MIDERFVYLGILLSTYGSLSYLIDTVKGKVKPNRVSWLFWATAPLIAFFAEKDKGVGVQSLMTFIVGFNPLLIFLASFLNKKAYWKLDRLDYFYGGLALIGLILWQITGEGNLAIFFSIMADGIAAIPTVIKSYEDPKSENYKVYFYSMLNAGLTLLTIKVWDFAHWGFPAYIFLICAILYSLIKFELGAKLKTRFATVNKQKLS
jgi:hypothetical protein